MTLTNQLLDINTSASSKFRNFYDEACEPIAMAIPGNVLHIFLIYIKETVLNQFATFQHTIVCDKTSVLFLNTTRIHEA